MRIHPGIIFLTFFLMVLSLGLYILYLVTGPAPTLPGWTAPCIENSVMLPGDTYQPTFAGPIYAGAGGCDPLGQLPTLNQEN